MRVAAQSDPERIRARGHRCRTAGHVQSRRHAERRGLRARVPRLAASRGPAVVLISSREAGDYGRRVETCGARGFISKSKLSAATFGALLE